MRIRQVLISERVSEKIYRKHGVLPDEAEGLLFSKPLIHRTKDGRYMAIGFFEDRYLTVIFEYAKGMAEIITAYPASEWQIRLYKRKRGKR